MFQEMEALYKENRYEDALEIVQRLDREFPHRKSIMFPLAACLMRVERLDEARELFEQLVVQHNDDQSRRKLAQIEARIARRARAEAVKAGRAGAKEAGRSPGPTADASSAIELEDDLEDDVIEGNKAAEFQSSPGDFDPAGTPSASAGGDTNEIELVESDTEYGISDAGKPKSVFEEAQEADGPAVMPSGTDSSGAFENLARAISANAPSSDVDDISSIASGLGLPDDKVDGFGEVTGIPSGLFGDSATPTPQAAAAGLAKTPGLSTAVDDPADAPDAIGGAHAGRDEGEAPHVPEPEPTVQGHSISYQIRGNPDFGELTCKLDPGQTVYLESGAMSRMGTAVQLKTVIRGGIVTALIRKFFAGESFFVGQYSSPRKRASVTASPKAPGTVVHRKIAAGESFNLAGGAYLASTENVKIRTRFHSLRAIFSSQGGFYMKCSGEGDIFFNGFGGVIEKQIDGELIIDTSHLVAWDPTLKFKITGSGGIIGTLFSGEGLVMKFKGKGVVHVQTRSLRGMAGWLKPVFRATPGPIRAILARIFG